MTVATQNIGYSVFLLSTKAADSALACKV